jgi:ketosteroid isomerase-like protein
MSQENASVRNEAVLRWFRAFDTDSAAFKDALHPDVEWFPIEENHSKYKGIESAMRLRNRWLETWGDHRFDLEEVIESGDSVVALVHITARGKGSGATVDVRFYARFEVREGKVALIFDHADRATALQAAGLSE